MHYLDEPDWTVGELPPPCECPEPCAGHEPKPKPAEELPFCPDCREPDGGHTPDCPSLKTDVGF